MSEETMNEASLRDPARLAALKRLQLLDTPPEESLDRLTRLAASIIDAPVALVSLVDDNRQFFKSAFGLPPAMLKSRETPLSHSFCKHVVMGQEPMIVKDSRKHPLLKHNPLSAMITSYAGMPLRAPTGESVGSFCVMDSKPRDWSVQQLVVLQDLAAAAMREFELRDLGRQLAAEQQMREELAEAVTADLTNPLKRLLIALQTSNEDGGLPPIAAIQARAEAQKVGIKLSDLIDVARLEAGTMVPKFQRVDLVKQIEVAVAKIDDAARDLHVGVEVKLPNRLPKVLADHRMVQRILLILLRHALRFTDVGGLVFLEATFTETEVRCSVSDSGLGLSDQVREQIFEGYLPDSPSRTPRLPQSGLGMAFCRRAVEAHGGRIGIFSQEGIGSTVWFTLPRA